MRNTICCNILYITIFSFYERDSHVKLMFLYKKYIPVILKIREIKIMTKAFILGIQFVTQELHKKNTYVNLTQL